MGMGDFLQIMLSGVSGAGESHQAREKKKFDDAQALELAKAQRGGKLQDAIALEMIKQKLGAAKGKNGVNFDYNDALTVDESGNPIFDIEAFSNLTLRKPGGQESNTSKPFTRPGSGVIFGKQPDIQQSPIKIPRWNPKTRKLE
jgi:hypothetical protein